MDENLKHNIANQFGNTSLGFIRIKKNLNLLHLSDEETEAYLKDVILSTPLEDIEAKGKNYYFRSISSNAILTLNSHSFTVITAKQISKGNRITRSRK